MKLLMRKAVIFTLFTAIVSSCATSDRSKENGPIVLGDSSTIVTEQDERKLKDLVAELEPVIPKPEQDTPAAQKPAEEQKPAAGETKPAATAQVRPVVTNGIQANFREASFGIEAVNGKLGGNKNLERANGAVYTWESGDLQSATIKVSQGVTKVSQRYQTAVILKSKYGDILIDALSTTSDWEPLKGAGGSYKVSGLDGRSLEYTDAGPAQIKNAIAKATRRRRMSRRAVEDLLRTVRHVKDANQKPLVVELRSVMWKIDGKDAQGRNFSKQIRVDIPL